MNTNLFSLFGSSGVVVDDDSLLLVLRLVGGYFLRSMSESLLQMLKN